MPLFMIKQSERKINMKFLKGKIAAVLTAASIGITALPVTAFAEALQSESVAVEYKATVAKPGYSIKGTPGKRKIKLTCKTSGATIYYTTDGSKPTTSDKKYTGLITITKDTKIRAIAVKSGSTSSVMTKTIKVKTLLGDVTGNGVIDESDYTRFKSYRAGKTSYVCKDNCDMDGSGGLSKKDLTLLREYLDETSEEDQEADDIYVEKPEMKIYKAYGGKSIYLTTEKKGATIYYTTDGSNPTKSDIKYTGRFVVEKDCTIKAVAYKDGSYSDVKSRTTTVGSTDKPYADKATNTEYTDSVKVTLKCDTASSRIYYTTDGKDPRDYGKLYKEPVELTGNTTLKFYAEAKGCRNSDVVTAEYKVKSNNFTIKGTVWDDTSSGTSDGKYQVTEKGINGITVKLLNTATNKYDDTTVTTSRAGVDGYYEFTSVKAGNKYKVVFQFNGQKYRAYPNVVTGGNQAVSPEVPQITIKNGGAYSAGNALLVAVNNYSSAIVSAYYNETYATTNTVYTGPAEDVSLALQSNIYGETSLKMEKTTVTSVETGKTTDALAKQKVFAGDVLDYTLRLTNNSKTETLSKGEIKVYLTDSVAIQSIKLANGNMADYALEKSENGTTRYIINVPETLPEKSLDFIITAKVNKGVKNGVTVSCSAEIFSYTYKNSCYDKNSIPGNFNGSVREADEAIGTITYGYESLTDSQTIYWGKGNDFTTPIYVGTSRVYKFYVTNGVDVNDFYVYSSDKSVIDCIASCTPTNMGTECILVVTGKKAGEAVLTISLTRDSKKLIDAKITVADLPAAQ